LIITRLLVCNMEMAKHNVGLLGRYFYSLKALACGSRFDPFLVVAILTLWVGFLTSRIVPVPEDSDRGVYVSVAERLLAGDTLYSDVYDNKEPLFYYFIAAQRALGSSADLAAEVMLIAIAVAATYLMALKVSSQWTAAAISCIAVPIILTGTSYVPGYSELPGIAVVLTAITALAYRRPVLAGSCLGLLVFTKLIYVPVALLGISCFLFARRQFFDVFAIALGACAAGLIVVGVLLARSELLPFIESIKLNFAYSQGPLIGSKTGITALLEHMRRIGRGAGEFVSELAPIALAITLISIVLSRIHDRSCARLAIAGACVSTLIGSLVMLLLTGLWDYHKQILYIPSIFAVLSLASLMDAAAKRARLPTLGLVILTGYLLAGAPDPTRYYQSFDDSYAKINRISLEAQRLLKIGDTGTYARLGRGDPHAHAIGLRHWKLACPRFHQYAFNPEAVLNKVFECASTSPTLIIASEFLDPDYSPASKEFVTRVKHLLNESYSCDADSGLRICRRRLERRERVIDGER
jgi:hypothetical protein